MLKKAEVIRKLYGPTAYALVGSLTGLRSGRRMCSAATSAAKQSRPTLAIVALPDAGRAEARPGARAAVFVVAILFLLSLRTLSTV
jgi:hypothetical protein